MVFLVYLQVVQSDSSEASKYSWRSSASLPLEPVNCAVQYLKGCNRNLRVSPSQLPARQKSNRFQTVQISVILLMRKLLFYCNKQVTRLCQIKRSLSYLLDSPHRLK